MKNLILSQTAFDDIISECCQYPLHETGGILIGAANGGDMIVPFVIGSGPNAGRSPVRFKPDVEWQQERLDEYF
ncbi:MAG: hypothetical protein P8X68_21245, partial [Desulfobacterales bacterium]